MPPADYPFARDRTLVKAHTLHRGCPPRSSERVTTWRRRTGGPRPVEISQRSSENHHRETSGTGLSECPRCCLEPPNTGLGQLGPSRQGRHTFLVRDARFATGPNEPVEQGSHWGSSGRRFKSGHPDHGFRGSRAAIPAERPSRRESRSLACWVQPRVRLVQRLEVRSSHTSLALTPASGRVASSPSRRSRSSCAPRLNAGRLPAHGGNADCPAG